jgi:hypothetical protein
MASTPPSARPGTSFDALRWSVNSEPRPTDLERRGNPAPR